MEGGFLEDVVLAVPFTLVVGEAFEATLALLSVEFDQSKDHSCSVN